MKSMKKISMIAAVFFALAFVTALADTAMAARTQARQEPQQYARNPDWVKWT